MFVLQLWRQEKVQSGMRLMLLMCPTWAPNLIPSQLSPLIQGAVEFAYPFWYAQVSSTIWETDRERSLLRAEYWAVDKWQDMDAHLWAAWPLLATEDGSFDAVDIKLLQVPVPISFPWSTCARGPIVRKANASAPEE